MIISHTIDDFMALIENNKICIVLFFHPALLCISFHEPREKVLQNNNHVHHLFVKPTDNNIEIELMHYN